MQTLEKITHQQQILYALYKTIAQGDEECYRFIIAWQKLVHGADDIVDRHIHDAEDVCAVFFTSCALYNSNYFIRFRDSLLPLVAMITSDYVDSNNPSMPQKDFLRAAGNSMLKFIAFHQGGYELVRKISPILNLISFKFHHHPITLQPE